MCQDRLFIVMYGFMFRARNRIMYVNLLSWRTVYASTRMLFGCLFSSLLYDSGNTHQNNTILSAYAVPHSSTYLILYISTQAEALINYTYLTNTCIQVSYCTCAAHHPNIVYHFLILLCKYDKICFSSPHWLYIVLYSLWHFFFPILVFFYLCGMN